MFSAYIMSKDTGTSKLCLVKLSKDLVDWKLCILCQESKGILFKNPRTESYQKLFEVVRTLEAIQQRNIH